MHFSNMQPQCWKPVNHDAMPSKDLQAKRARGSGRMSRSAEKAVCNFCGSGESKPFIPEFRIVQCMGCGLVYTNDIPTLEALREIYSREYFISAVSKELGYDDYAATREEIKRTFLKRLKMLENLRRKKPKGWALDVGCAMGFFVETARENGWRAEGIDISSYCVEHGNSQGLKLYESTLQDYEAQDGSFDLITMWDYIEHSPDPRRDLAKAFQLLKKNGLLAVTAPDISSLPARVFKENWMGFKQREHLFYFSRNILKDMLRQIGFEVVCGRHAGKHVSLEFFARRLGLYFPGVSRILRFAIGKGRLANFQFYCNPFDITLLVARKP